MLRLWSDKFWANKFFRFLVIGGLNTVFGYTMFAIFIFLGLNYVIAITLATILGVFFNFKTIGAIVFESHDNKLILKFFGVYGTVYLFNLLGLKLLNNYPISNYVAGAILLLPAAIIGFVLNRKFVFNKSTLPIVEE